MSRAARHDPSDVHLTLLLADVGWVIGSLVIILWWNLGRGLPGGELWSVLGYAPPAMLVSFGAIGAYKVPLTAGLFTWWTTALKGLFFFFLTVVAAIYVFKLEDLFPRLAIGMWAIGSGLGLLGIRTACFLILRRSNRNHHLAQPVVLVGRLPLCLAMIDHFNAHPDVGMRAMAIATDDPDTLDNGLPNSRIEGVARLAQEVGSSRVIICARPDESDVIDRVMEYLMPYPFEVDLAPDMSNLQLFCLQVENHGGFPFINLTGSPLSAGDLVVKRIEDVVLSLVILTLISWLLVLIAITVKVLSPGPVFFIQNRHGLMGRTIRVFKFRTMTWHGKPTDLYTDASNAADPLMQPSTGLFRATVPGDARVTPFGKFLRNSSLDELPQFFNVLQGSMSIVGPRPHARLHNLKYITDIPWLMRRHYVKPGITGLAQISGARGETRSLEDMERRVAFDLQYIQTWSLWLDLQIILQTVFKGFWNRQP